MSASMRSVYAALKTRLWSRSPSPARVPAALPDLPPHPFVPGLGHRWWGELFALVEARATADFVRPAGLVQALDRIPLTAQAVRALLGASRFCISLGLISLGGALRLKARDIALALLADGGLLAEPELHTAAISALAEVGRWEDCVRELAALPSSRAAERRALASLVLALGPKGLRGSHAMLAQTLPRDPAFVEAVAGRRIAVVGPAASAAGQGPLIDAHDLVARFNYKEEGVGLDPLHKGARCDLVYFNRTQTRHLLAEGDLERFPRAPRWLMSKRQEDADALAAALNASTTGRARPDPGRRHRGTPVFEIPLFHGILNGAPNAVLDLLHSGAGEVEVFHADFMLSVERTPRYDPRVSEHMDAVRLIVKGFAGVHDPITQFALMKAGWQAGRLGGDGPFLAALALDEQAYVDALQRLYGTVFLNIAGGRLSS